MSQLRLDQLLQAATRTAEQAPAAAAEWDSRDEFGYHLLQAGPPVPTAPSRRGQLQDVSDGDVANGQVHVANAAAVPFSLPRPMTQSSEFSEFSAMHVELEATALSEADEEEQATTEQAVASQEPPEGDVSAAATAIVPLTPVDEKSEGVANAALADGEEAAEHLLAAASFAPEHVPAVAEGEPLEPDSVALGKIGESAAMSKSPPSSPSDEPDAAGDRRATPSDANQLAASTRSQANDPDVENPSAPPSAAAGGVPKPSSNPGRNEPEANQPVADGSARGEPIQLVGDSGPVATGPLAPQELTPIQLAELETTDEPADQRPSAESQRNDGGLHSLTRLPRSAARATNDRAAAEAPPRVDAARFLERVAGAFRMAQDRGGLLQLRLSPPELGSLRLEITVKEGALTAAMETESAAARQVLLEHLPTLRQRLAEQNIRIDRFDVEVRREDDSGQPDADTRRQFQDQRQEAPPRGQFRRHGPVDDVRPPAMAATSPAGRSALDLVI